MEEKQIQEHQGHVQQALKCPRCDSSNTKFCYYNNYSLSQPRHFCKACKRYWTRGGTLRNVPVGGGYRKNKRVKKGNSIVDHHREISSSSSSTPGVNPSGVQSSQGVDTSLLSARSHINNPLLYSLRTNTRSEVNNLPYSLRDSYGLNLPQFKVGGNGELGFSSVLSQKAGGGGELGFSSVTSQKVTGTTGELGFSSVTSQNLGLSGTNMSLASLNHPLLSSAYPIYGTSTSTSTMAPSQQKIVSNGYNDIAQTPYGFMGFDDLQMLRNSNNEGYDMLAKDVKMEGHGNWFDSLTNQNFVQEINSLDQSFMWNSSVGAGVRSNPSNIGC